MVEWAGATLITADASVEGMARCMETGGNGDDVMGWPGVFEGIQRYRPRAVSAQSGDCAGKLGAGV